MDAADAIIDEVVAGDPQAWPRLAELIAERIVAIARSHGQLRSRGLAGAADDIAEVQTATLERLARHDHSNLRKYVEQRDRTSGVPQSFDSWLYGAVEFVIRDHLRTRYGRARRTLRVDGPTPSKRDINSHAGMLEEEHFDATYLRHLGMTARLTLAQIFAYVDETFTASEAAALRSYYEDDQSFGEIAQTLGLSGPGEAEKLIRRLNARLRYKFVG